MTLFLATACLLISPVGAEAIGSSPRFVMPIDAVSPILDSIPAAKGPTNTFLGYDAACATIGISNATAIGANAKVAVSNGLVLGNGANVGIGTDSPLVRLHVVSGTDGESGLRLENLTSGSDAHIKAANALTVDESGNVVLGAITGVLWDQTDNGYVQSSGLKGVLIGDRDMPTPPGYNLFVSGGILTEKVKVAVKASADWADYVLARGYRLRSLPATKYYINQHGHLPGIPSADEVVANGVDLGRINAQLLGKVEELTLHLIRLEERINQLELKKKPRVRSVIHDHSSRHTTGIHQ